MYVYPALLYTKRYGTLYTETISPEEGEGDKGTPAPIRRRVHGEAEEEETSGGGWNRYPRDHFAMLGSC